MENSLESLFLRCEQAQYNLLATFDKRQTLMAERIAIFTAATAMLHEIVELHEKCLGCPPLEPGRNSSINILHESTLFGKALY